MPKRLSPLSVPDIGDDDIQDLSKLTAQESFTIDGQIVKMKLIEQMVQQRWEAHRRKVRQELQAAGSFSERELNARVQPIRIRHLNLGDRRFNLIIEKGSPAESHKSRKPLSICVPAHVDTVEGDRLQLGVEEDRLTGLGVYDMAPGIINNISLAAEAVVPPGMIVYFVFTVDEEEHSLGATSLVRHWEQWKNIDIVVSNEIGPSPVPEEGDKAMRYSPGRRGRAKFMGRIYVDQKTQGHGAQPRNVSLKGHKKRSRIPNASRALARLLTRSEDLFLEGGSGKGQGPFQLKHRLLGEEEYEMGELMSAKKAGYFSPHLAEFEISFQLVPPNTVDNMLAKVRRAFAGIAEEEEWEELGISWELTLTPTATSYEPYAMNEGNRVAAIVQGILTRITGVRAAAVGALSVADECIYATHLAMPIKEKGFKGFDKGVISIPPVGDLAHNEGEWVSRRSIAQTRLALRMLIEHETGFVQLIDSASGTKR